MPKGIKGFQKGNKYRFQKGRKPHNWKDGLSQTPKVRKVYNHKYHFTYGDNIRQRKKEKHKKLRMEILNHYSNNSPKCVCCEETLVEFLAIDHIDGGGCEHRKKINIRSGSGFYKWLKRNNYPKGYRILCHNCNFSRGRYGYCPHNNGGNTNG